jgi:hypothetical protein
MGYYSRLPNSNDPPVRRKSPWGPTGMHDDFSLLLNREGARCGHCKRVTQNRYLDDNGLCPDEECQTPKPDVR